MDHNEVFTAWPPQRKDVSGVIIAVVGVVGICVIVFTLMSIGNYHGASYPLASAQWGETFINFTQVTLANFTHWFWRIFTPALPG